MRSASLRSSSFNGSSRAALALPPPGLLVVLLAFAVALHPTQAQVYVDADASGAGDGTSWTDAYTDLQAALASASSGDEIWITEGIYVPGSSPEDSFEITGSKDGLEIYGGFEGTETNRSGRDPARHVTVLSGDIGGDDDVNADGVTETPGDINGDNAYHVLMLDGRSTGSVTDATVIDGVTITAGQAGDEDGTDENLDDGGGLYCDAFTAGSECSPTLTDVVFAGNTADGGDAESNDGGAIFNLSANGGTASPKVTNAVFTSNSATHDGGAIFNTAGNGTTSPQLTNAVFTGNSAGHDGGAIYSAAGSNGTANPQITNTVFVGNSAGHDGGALFNGATGGGTTSPQFTNAVLTNNSADHNGGGLFNSGALSTSEPLVENTILWGNSADVSGNQVSNASATPTFSHSIVEGSGGSSSWDGSLGTDGGGNLDEDPQFGDSNAPAGSDGSFATRDDGLNVAGDSPALDAGTNGALDFDDDGTDDVATDLAGADRVLDRDGNGTATVNIGAYEEVSVAITGGGADGLGRTFTATPGENDQPIGVFRLTAAPSGADLTEVTVTPDASGATGVDRAALWSSSDNAFGASDDTELASVGTDPSASLPSTLTFGGIRQTLPAQARYLFVTVDLTSDAEGTVTGLLDSEADLSLDGGAITKVNGTAGKSQFSRLPLSGDATALPVELAGFEAAQVDEESVRLTWQTTSEQNNAGFEVQRTSPPFNQWSTLGFVEGAGTTPEPRSYRFTDTELPYEAETVRYRLRQVDTDGTTRLSNEVTVELGAPKHPALRAPFPNPAESQATLRYAVPSRQDITLSLYDALGRQVKTVTDGTGKGRREVQLDVSSLPSGTYFLRLRAGGTVKTESVTVVR